MIISQAYADYGCVALIAVPATGGRGLPFTDKITLPDVLVGFSDEFVRAVEKVESPDATSAAAAASSSMTPPMVSMLISDMAACAQCTTGFMTLSPGERVVKVAFGGTFAVALVLPPAAPEAGPVETLPRVLAVGTNASCALGPAFPAVSRVWCPVDFGPKISPRVVNVACGKGHLLLLLNNGTVHGLGENDHAQVGIGRATKDPVRKPTKVLASALNVWAGPKQGFALLPSLELVGWGENIYGQLGLPCGEVVSKAARITRWSRVSNSSTKPPLRSLSCSNGHTCFIEESGSLFCFGMNINGELGLCRTSSSSVDAPQPVVAAGAGPVVSACSGPKYTVMVDAEGRVFAAGDWASVPSISAAHPCGNASMPVQYFAPVPMPFPVFGVVKLVATGHVFVAVGKMGHAILINVLRRSAVVLPSMQTMTWGNAPANPRPISASQPSPQSTPKLLHRSDVGGSVPELSRNGPHASKPQFNTPSPIPQNQVCSGLASFQPMLMPGMSQPVMTPGMSPPMMMPPGQPMMMPAYGVNQMATPSSLPRASGWSLPTANSAPIVGSADTFVSQASAELMLPESEVVDLLRLGMSSFEVLIRGVASGSIVLDRIVPPLSPLLILRTTNYAAARVSGGHVDVGNKISAHPPKIAPRSDLAATSGDEPLLMPVTPPGEKSFRGAVSAGAAKFPTKDVAAVLAMPRSLGNGEESLFLPQLQVGSSGTIRNSKLLLSSVRLPPPPKMDVASMAPLDLDVNLDEIQRCEILGSGAYGVVHRAIFRGEVVAMKLIRPEALSDPKAMADFESEMALMRRVSRHPNVAQLVGYSTKAGEVFLLTRFYELGSLEAILLRRPPLPWLTKMRLARDVAHGVAFLHENGVVHRDIAARNVLVSGRMSAVLSDFGLSRVFEKSDQQSAVTKSTIGPVRWMAPEALLDRKYSEKTDAYSFSMLLVEICLDGLEPYSENSNLLYLAKLVVMEGFRPTIPSYVPAELSDLMRSLWDQDPAARPTMHEARDALDNLVAIFEAESLHGS